MSRFDIVDRTMLICADTTAQVVTAAGERFDVDGIFDNAQVDVSHKREGTTGAGGINFKHRQPVFTTADKRVTGIDKQWRLIIKGESYYCPEPYSDGAGWVTLWLARSVGDFTEAEAVQSGNVWR